ncbi:TonB-dependent receptor [Brevundimonas fontaquae]|uniref:TonB-dependent receptor n=1 Tax=Brevundimonas fontaquae TaxID=2813778 RepID=A0ABX7LPZ4_9CAUL|nr:TonB-dependent receptor [Brevundimonas fontaquae]QSF54842.1 TonB-dependent receptor [Brevundimonas fontaquae]
MNRLSLLSGSAIVACAVAISATACAQDAREFNIPAGSLRDALNLFATQSDQQILFSGDLVAGRTTPGLTGRFAPRDALDRLLAGSGISWSQGRPGVIFLRRSTETLANTETVTALEDIIVTGTLLKRSGDLASPVVVFDRDALDRRGFGTVAEVLTDLPQNYAGSGTPIVQMTASDRQGSNAVNATGVNLRGLGPASTLTLVNGRRVAGTGFRGEFGDVSALPSAAVERVDVLLDGASALYGADAVAGVVNVVMRQVFDGQESRARVSLAEGGGEDVIVSHLAGRSWSTGSAYLSYEYQTSNPLSSLDRSYTATGDLRPFGGTDHRALYSAPGNILSFNPAAGAYVAQYAIRPNASGTAQTAADFVAGGANLQAISRGVDLTPSLERHSAYGRIHQSVGDRLELTADVRYNRRTYEFAGAASIGVFNVTRSNPYFVSPTGAASHILGYSFAADLGNTRQSGASESLGAQVGRALLEPVLSRIGTTQRLRQVFEHPDDGGDEGPAVEAADILAQKVIELLQPDGVDGAHLVLCAPPRVLGRSDRHRHQNRLSIASRRGREAMDVVQVEPGFSGFKTGVCPDGDPHGSGRFRLGHPAVAANRLQGRRQQRAIIAKFWLVSTHPRWPLRDQT